MAGWSEPQMASWSEPPTAIANWSEPRVLLTRDDQSLLQVNIQTINELRKIKRKLSVISVAGSYRTGKSYLLSRLIKLAGGKATTFQVSASSRAVTKGIWVYYMNHPENDTGVLLLDTEGLGDPIDGDKNFDYRIMCISLLLCSNFLFNQSGEIDTNAIRILRISSAISNHIIVKKNNENPGEVADCFPEFTLVVRNFQSELEKDETTDQYMEKKIFSKKPNDKSEENNLTQIFRSYFVKRRCFTLPSPALGKVLKSLSTESDDKLDQDFVADFKSLYNKVLVEASPKIVNLVDHVNGLAFALLIDAYKLQVNKQKTFNVEEAIQSVGKKVNEDLINESIQIYKSCVNDVLHDGKSSAKTSADILITVFDAHSKGARYALQNFLTQIMDVEIDGFFRSFKKELRNAYVKTLKIVVDRDLTNVQQSPSNDLENILNSAKIILHGSVDDSLVDKVITLLNKNIDHKNKYFEVDKVLQTRFDCRAEELRKLRQETTQSWLNLALRECEKLKLDGFLSLFSSSRSVTDNGSSRTDSGSSRTDSGSSCAVL